MGGMLYLCARKPRLAPRCLHIFQSVFNRSHIAIFMSVLLCAVSATGAPGLASAPEIQTQAAQKADTDTIGIVRHLFALILRRTLVSEADSDSLAALTPGLQQEAARPVIQRKKVDLDNTVNFSAKDSLVMIGQNSAYMFGESQLDYGDMSLTAAEIKNGHGNKQYKRPWVFPTRQAH